MSLTWWFDMVWYGSASFGHQVFAWQVTLQGGVSSCHGGLEIQIQTMKNTKMQLESPALSSSVISQWKKTWKTMGHGLQNIAECCEQVRATSHWQVSSFSSRSDRESCCRWFFWNFVIILPPRAWTGGHHQRQGRWELPWITSSYLKTWPQLSWEQLELLEEKNGSNWPVYRHCRSAWDFISSLRLRIDMIF